MKVERISSLQNPKIKNLKKLEKARERRGQELILIEGLRETILAQRAGYSIQSLFVCEELLKTEGEYRLSEIPYEKKGIGYFEITKEVYESLAYRETTEGVIATAKPHSHELINIKLKTNSLILVIESVEKPGNLGAMLRTCDAAGADAVIICDPHTDIYNPNVVRSSIGTVFTNQIAVCETKEAIRFFKENQVNIFAADPEATKYYYERDFRQNTAIVVGAESTGLSDEWIKAADDRIKIPMNGEIDSLNVSVSAAVLLFEAVRQRKAGKI